jgi:hypothetical protein
LNGCHPVPHTRLAIKLGAAYAYSIRAGANFYAKSLAPS